MKKIFVLIVAFFVVWQGVGAEVLPDTVWTKQLWQLGSRIKKVKFTPDNRNIAVAIGDGVYILDILNGNLIKEFKGNFMIGINEFIFSEGGDSLITSSEGGKLIIWNYRTTDTVKTFQGATGCMNLITNRSILAATGSADKNEIIIRDLNLGSILKTSGIVGNVYNLAIFKQKNIFAAALARGSYPNYSIVVEIWDLAKLEMIFKLGNHNERIEDLEFSSDGKYLASASPRDGLVKIWDLESRTLIKTLDHDSLHHNGLSIAFSPRGGYLVTSGGNGYDWTTKIWDFKTFDLVYKYPALFGANGDMDISYDSLFIILARSNKIFLLNSKWKSLGLEDKLDFNLRVLYPNPAGTSITIPLEQSRSAGKIILKNLEGITIKSINNIQPFINELILDISSIPAGTYFVLIDYLSKSITYKFEKIR